MSILFKSVFFYLVIFLLSVSIFSWSIRDFLKHQPELFRSFLSTSEKPKEIIPQDLTAFAQTVKDYSAENEDIYYISQDGAGEKEFFMLSYLLYPRKIIWISDVIPGPISWWTQGTISETEISRLGEGKNINWIITYDYDLVNSAKKINIIKETDYLRLYKIL